MQLSVSGEHGVLIWKLQDKWNSLFPEQKRYPLLSQFSDEKSKTRRLQAKKSCTAYCEALATLSDLLLTPPRSYGLDWLPIKKSRPSNVNNHFTRAKTVLTRAQNAAHARTKTPRPCGECIPNILDGNDSPYMCLFPMGKSRFWIHVHFVLFPMSWSVSAHNKDQFSTPE